MVTFRRAGWLAGGLVVAREVEGKGAQELSGGSVDDPDIEVLDQHEDVGSGVGSTDADVEQATGHAQGDGAAEVHMSRRRRRRGSASVTITGDALGSVR
jgi:hypothetical protein